MRYVTPKTLDEALLALADGPLTVLAGGTDVYPSLQGRSLGDALDLTRVAGLRGIERREETWRIGGGTTWADVIRAELPPAFDGLKAAAREVGSIQIQNAGTLAGNLCNASPAADGAPCLLSLGASVELASARGTRTLPLDAFLKGVRETDRAADELLTAILVPEPALGTRGGFAKLGARRYLVISIVMTAATLRVDNGRLRGVRLAIGACAPTALRLTDMEAALEDAVPDAIEGIVADAPLPLAPIDDVRGSGAYREDAARTQIARLLAGLSA